MAMLQPEGRFGLILLPGFSFPAWQGLVVAMGVDVAGLLLGWKMFDHGAHLVRAWTPAAPSAGWPFAVQIVQYTPRPNEPHACPLGGFPSAFNRGSPIEPSI